MEADYKPGSLPYPMQDNRRLFCKFHYKGVLLVIIPIVLAPILLGGPEQMAYRMLYLASCVYLYFVLDVMALAGTALLFLVFVPLFGITSSRELCEAHYGSSLFKTLGGIFMGIAMDTTSLSQRLALIMLRLTGPNIRTINLFFLLMTAFTSIFVCNTVTVVFWMKIAKAIIDEYGKAGVLKIISEDQPYEHQADSYPSYPVVGIYLSIAYAGTLGTMVSPVQHPNRLIFKSLRHFMKISLSGIWQVYILPFGMGLLSVAVWINVMFLGVLRDKGKQELEDAEKAYERIELALDEKRANLGRWPINNILLLTFICLLVVSMLLRDPVWLGDWAGWSSYIRTYNRDSVPTFIFCLLIFAIPANYLFCHYCVCRQPESTGAAPSLLKWKVASQTAPWAHILMMASANSVLLPYMESKLMDLVYTTIYQSGYSKWSYRWVGASLGTLITNCSPSGNYVHEVFRDLIKYGTQMNVPPMPLAVSYGSSLHNTFLLPFSSSNTMVCAWGNLRPYQFLLGGIVPTIVILIFTVLAIGLMGDSYFKDF